MFVVQVVEESTCTPTLEIIVVSGDLVREITKEMYIKNLYKIWRSVQYGHRRKICGVIPAGRGYPERQRQWWKYIEQRDLTEMGIDHNWTRIAQEKAEHYKCRRNTGRTKVSSIKCFYIFSMGDSTILHCSTILAPVVFESPGV